MLSRYSIFNIYDFSYNRHCVTRKLIIEPIIQLRDHLRDKPDEEDNYIDPVSITIDE